MKNKFKRSFSVLAALALLLVSVAGVTPVSLAESIDQAYTDDSGHSQKAKKLIGEERSDSELPLSEGEITTIQSSDATFSISLNENIEPEPIENAEFIDEEEEGEDSGGVLSALGGFFGGILDFIFPSMEAKAASDTMKVSYSGYVNFCGHRMLLGEASVKKDEPSDLDRRMYRLAQTSKDGVNHPAYVAYQKVMGGAGDTVRSIIISTNARLARLENESVLRLLDHDDMHFEEMGCGVNGDEQTKTALFCLIPDSDKTYNFIVGMLYTQAFQRLYRVADSMYGGELPIHVTFLMDEFANVALPDDFCSLISTMRSRSISSIIILQNLAQIKAMFKDTWETITGNCDTTIYLGGNEQSTHEYMSKLLGKATIEKRSTGESRGRQGSSSRNYDVLGRDLMTPDEVNRLDRNKCLIKVAGQPPVIDEKYNTPKHPRFAESADGNGEPFVLKKKKNRYIGQPFEFLSEKSVGYYEKLQQAGDSVEITTVTYDELMMQNARKGRATWLYIDECHVLLKSDYSAFYLQQLWKKVRKQGGLCTGISQNVSDLLQSDVAATLISNSEFIVILKQSDIDSMRMRQTIGVTDAQLEFVKNSPPGTGLIKCGTTIVPFDNRISKDNILYDLYNTNVHEKAAKGQLDGIPVPWEVKQKPDSGGGWLIR